MQVMKEWAYIHTFVRHCDSIGTPRSRMLTCFSREISNPRQSLRARNRNQRLAAPRHAFSARIGPALSAPDEAAGLVHKVICRGVFHYFGRARSHREEEFDAAGTARGLDSHYHYFSFETETRPLRWGIDTFAYHV